MDALKDKLILESSQVFVPGGFPVYTYNPRSDIGLEKKLSVAAFRSNKITTVTGSTKSGKTVLVRNVLKDKPTVWLEGALVTSMDVFWELIGDELEILSEVGSEIGKEQSNELSSEFSAEGNAIIAKGSGKMGGKRAEASVNTRHQSLVVSKSAQASKAIRSKKIAIVVDDFHYIKRDLQKIITRSVKALVFEGVPVVFIAIPQRKHDTVKAEREMNSRIAYVEVPPWSVSELIEISEKGFRLLNVEPNLKVSRDLGFNAFGSPHLMQEFCTQICLQNGYERTEAIPRALDPTYDYSRIFNLVAGEHGRNIFDKLALGSSQPLNPLVLTKNSGGDVDIYKGVLIALSRLRPNIATITIDDLRGMMRAIFTGEPPRADEVVLVIEQMATISATEESSVSVIDYEQDESKVHITDPFFAFFLQWGKALIES